MTSPNSAMFIVSTYIYKIIASKPIHAFNYFQGVVMTPSSYNLPARCDDNTVIIVMFI